MKPGRRMVLAALPAALLAGGLVAGAFAGGEARAGEPAPAVTRGERPRGVVRSLAEATISGELPARIVAMPFREGQSFATGDVLAAFDCVRLSAEVDAARAELAAARASYEGTREMERFKAIGAREVAIAAARMDKAAADVAGGVARLSGCTIRAPFDGIVTERLAREHEVVAPSTPLLRIVDDRQLEIELIAPSQWLSWLEPGQRFTFHVDETGRDHPAALTRVAGVVDPISQTIKLFAVFSQRDAALRHGMSGTAMFEPER